MRRIKIEEHFYNPDTGEIRVYARMPLPDEAWHLTEEGWWRWKIVRIPPPPLSQEEIGLLVYAENLRYDEAQTLIEEIKRVAQEKNLPSREEAGDG